MHNEELLLFQSKNGQRYVSPLISAWPLESRVSVHYSDKPMETSKRLKC